MLLVGQGEVAAPRITAQSPIRNTRDAHIGYTIRPILHRREAVACVDCIRFKSHLLKTPFCHIHKLNRDSNSVKDDLRICDTV